MPKASRAADRTELAAFLRSCRERLPPAQAGLPTTARRRTPGLRREEVAHLAGVGVTWYTWLEQGRDIQVSVHVLDAISRALKLTEAERAHLFNLAHDRPPPRSASTATWVTPAHQRLLESLAGPAYLATPRWDVVAWNTALAAVFGDLALMPPERRNMLWLMFASEEHRITIPNWENDARGMVAKFRIEFGRHRDDGSFLKLIEELRKVSHHFHRWWAEQDVTRRPEVTKRFRSAKFGDKFEQTSFVAAETPDLRLTVYTPMNVASERVVRRCISAFKARRRK